MQVEKTYWCLEDMQYYNIQTLNVNGTKNPIKRSYIISKFKREQVGIGFLQETHLSNEEHEKIKKMGYRKTYFAFHRSGKKEGWPFLHQTISDFILFQSIKIKKADLCC